MITRPCATRFGRAARYACMLCGLVLALLPEACAEERDPVNRVQANALQKRFFVGKDLSSPADDPEFYSAMTVIDVPFGADQQAGVFTGLVGELYRIKWEITEDVLNARLTYEMIEGSDAHGARTTNTGRVIASYKIESHFDVKHSYNPTTGEELNIVEENTTDRPWNQREFFRVDWSKNLINTSWWDPLAQSAALGSSFETESVSYYVDDPKAPDAPHFSAKDGYFDFVNKLYLKPTALSVGGQSVVNCSWRGAFVSYGTYPWGNCENSEVTVRVSFRKVAEPGEPGYSDYEAIDWDGARMNAFGMFWKDRLGWDDHYGVVDHKWRRFGMRHNIWKASHAKDASGKPIRCNGPETIAAGADPTRDLHPACLLNGQVVGEPDAGGRCTRGSAGSAPDGTDDECVAAGPGSQCDVLAGQCTIPYAKRETKPVVWHYTVGAPDPLIFASTRLASWEWDTAMRLAVQSARRVECVRTSGASLQGTRWEGQPCDTAFPIDQRENAELEKVSAIRRCWDHDGYGAPSCAPPEADKNTIAAQAPMVVLCSNPVAASDDPVCGKPGLTVRPGDIRYHHVNVWPTRQTQSPWGYGPSLADPLTGELISVGINVYGSVTDTTAQSVVDTVRWMNGELTSTQITSGDYVRDWVAVANNSPEVSRAAWPTMTKQEADRRVMGVMGVSPEKFQNLAALRANFDPKPLKDLALSLHATRVPLDMPGNAQQTDADARLARLKGTPIESELMNPMWLQLAGVSSSTQVTDSVLDVASPIRGMRPENILEREHTVENALMKSGQCMMAAPEPTGLPTFARLMARKFPYTPDASPGAQAARNEKMWNYVRSRLNYSVILHEMGHTFGLTHNFVGSYDKFNYRPQYWQLRTKGGTVETPCTGEPTQGDCVGPRYLDPPDQEEIDGSIWTWMNTTVMDYAGDLTHDMLGLGVYDYAAARMFYGDVVDVRNDKLYPAAAVDARGGDIAGTGTPQGEAIKDMVDFAGGVFGQIVDVNGKVVHHTQFDKEFKLLWNCRKVTPQAPSYWNEAEDGTWDPVFDGHIVRNEVCDRAPVEYQSWRDLIPDRLAIFGDPKYFIPRRGKDRTGRPRVPYGMELDWYADGGSPPAYLHDAGADMYEEMVFHSNMYENRHIFDNFRNGKTTFSIYGAYSRALSRYHSKIASLTGGFAFAVDFILRQFAQETGQSFETAATANVAELMYDHAIAASVGFDHFSRVMTRPQSGDHFKRQDDELVKSTKDLFVSPSAFSYVVTVPNGTSIASDGSMLFGGRPVSNELDYGNGAWNSDYLNQAGSYYEKALAMELMLAASHDTVNLYRFDALDSRPRHISYANLYPDGMRRLIGMLLTEDYGLIAQRISTRDDIPETVDDKRDPQTRYPARSLGWVSWVPKAGPEVCWANANKLACKDSFGSPVGDQPNLGSLPLEPEWGWEMQKFVVLWAYVYLPSSEVWDWADLMRIYRSGSDPDPTFEAASRVEFRDPVSGVRYTAKRYGNEPIFGKTYDKGIAAKMIQWANQLTVKAYETTSADPQTGAVNVVLDANGSPKVKVDPSIESADPANVSCDDNRACTQLRYYRGLLDFTHDLAVRLGYGVSPMAGQ